MNVSDYKLKKILTKTTLVKIPTHKNLYDIFYKCILNKKICIFSQCFIFLICESLVCIVHSSNCTMKARRSIKYLRLALNTQTLFQSLTKMWKFQMILWHGSWYSGWSIFTLNTNSILNTHESLKFMNS